MSKANHYLSKAAIKSMATEPTKTEIEPELQCPHTAKSLHRDKFSQCSIDPGHVQRGIPTEIAAELAASMTAKRAAKAERQGMRALARKAKRQTEDKEPNDD